MRYFSILITLFWVGSLYSQDVIQIPHPYILTGADLTSGGGYQPVAPYATAGFRIDSNHLIADLNGSYEATQKINDNTGYNPKGRRRSLEGNMYYRLPNQWFFGAGAQWGQLSTTNYTKSNWHPNFGGGKDFLTRDCAFEGCSHDFTARVSIDYIMRGSDWQNGCQGPRFSLYLPSPAAKRHFFYRQTFSLYRFHDTVTDRSDPLLTRQESSVHHLYERMELGIMYRF